MDEQIEMRIEEVFTVAGDRFRVNHDDVIEIERVDEGGIIIRMQPLKRRQGDKDGWYLFERRILLPWHFVAGIVMVGTDGAWGGW